MRLICFGDSWTAGHGVEGDPAYERDGSPPIFIERLRLMNSWPRWLANELDCPFVNLGECGISNEMILSNIQKVIENHFLMPEDVIVVMFSHPQRFRTSEISPEKTFLEMEKILGEYQHFYLNSFYPTFMDEKNFKITSLPEYFIQPDQTLSNVLKKYEQNHNTSVWEHGNRRGKDMIGEFHPNILGYKIIAKHIYQQIKDKVHH